MMVQDSEYHQNSEYHDAPAYIVYHPVMPPYMPSDATVYVMWYRVMLPYKSSHVPCRVKRHVKSSYRHVMSYRVIHATSIVVSRHMTRSTYSGTPSENGRRRRKKLSGQKALINGFWANLQKSRVVSTRRFIQKPVNKRFLPSQPCSSSPPVFGGR